MKYYQNSIETQENLRDKHRAKFCKEELEKMRKESLENFNLKSRMNLSIKGEILAEISEELRNKSRENIQDKSKEKYREVLLKIKEILKIFRNYLNQVYAGEIPVGIMKVIPEKLLKEFLKKLLFTGSPLFSAFSSWASLLRRYYKQLNSLLLVHTN